MLFLLQVAVVAVVVAVVVIALELLLVVFETMHWHVAEIASNLSQLMPNHCKYV